MRAIVIAFVALALACGKTDSSNAGKPAPSGAAPSASSSASARPGASAASSAAPAGPVEWNGTYEATEGTLYVPEGKEYEGVKFRGEKSPAGLGKGTLRLESDARGIVVGSIEGPLGPGVVSGTIDKEGAFSARIDPKTPALDSFYGTLTGKREGDAIEATLHVSQAEARVIREAKVSLKRK